MNYYIYKYVNGDTIEYIGETTDLARRIEQHKKDKLKNFKGKIYYFECPNKTAMDSWEYCLINKYHPKYNAALKDIKTNINIEEPEWILYMDNAITYSSNKVIDIKRYLTPKTISNTKSTRTFTCYKCHTTFTSNEYRYTKTKIATICPNCHCTAYTRK